MQNITALMVLTIFPLGMVVAGVSDMFTMTISNKVSLGLVAGFLVVALFSGMAFSTIGMHLLAGLAMLALSFSLFAKGWIGGGDAKLFAASAIWMGWPNLLEYVVIISFLGGILTIGLIIMRYIPAPEFLTRQKWFSRIHSLESGIPYGIALAVGGLLLYPHSVIFSMIAA